MAEAAGGVPLLWLALFRPNDLRHWSVDDENESDLAITPKDRALAQLHAALPRLNELLVANGALGEYARLLEQALVAHAGRVVAWDFTERTWLDNGPDEYRAKVAYLLEFFKNPQALPPPIKRPWITRLFSRAPQRSSRRRAQMAEGDNRVRPARTR